MTPSVNVDVRWFVCHTRPKCEKRFAGLMESSDLEYYLPLYTSAREYFNRRGNRTEIKYFTKPLFRSYVFCRLPLDRKMEAYQRDYVVRLIPVDNERRFLRQLDSIKLLLEAGVELDLCPPLKKGARVRICDGPLTGVEGVVEDPGNPDVIVVAIDILQQGVLTNIPRAELELIDDD